MDDADDAEEFADATLRRMVREIRPKWSLRDAAPADEGTDVVYFVTVETPDGPRECVLKACEFLDPEAFRPEPYLVALVDRRTSIPVPSVVGAVDDHDDLPAPFFLMECRDGEVRENGARELPADAMERLARDAGRHIGELHALGEFEAFGGVRLARDVDGDRGELTVGEGHIAADRDRPTVDGRALTTDETASDSWRTRVEATADDCLGDLHDRFADLESDLRALVDDRLDALDREFAPVLGHDDYRLGNLLVDPATGETRAVLDWGNANTLEPQYNLVLAEQYLSGWAPHDDPLRERVRAALREGYREVGELADDSDAERRRELYLTVTRLFPLVWFSLWYGHRPESEREATVEKHRRAVRDLLAR
ncbi:phosphotransferase family protein [Halorussus salinisoli]|uniref:phosphotransferase family protein n=1 Tax=Halorussus salinisoli TaxID=2558242 RepID=UPI0014850BF3|nr:phosphotransferase [Halorussus salinisoli]